jgi:hypothetical protein
VLTGRAKGLVEPRSARRQDVGDRLPDHYPAPPQHGLRQGTFPWRGTGQKLRQRTFDLRDFPAQGKNSLLRQGGCRHDGLPSRAFVPVMFL